MGIYFNNLEEPFEMESNPFFIDRRMRDRGEMVALGDTNGGRGGT